MPKNIALFVDGTWNAAAGEGDTGPTNVSLLHDRMVPGGSQSRDYLTGIGTEYEEQPDDGIPASPFRRLLKRVMLRMPLPIRRRMAGWFGLGSKGRITRAYRILSSKYDYGDHIYLFGFSRGALAVRSLAGFVDAVGLLLKEAEDRLVEEAYRLYEKRKDPTASALKAFLRATTGSGEPDPERGTQLPIYFIGLWDTVAALGLPGPFGAVSAHWTRHHQTELPFNVTHARHALALHELRTTFPALLWHRRHPANPHQTLKQVWFPGAHADVGGGYRDDPRLSDVALEWMAKEAEDTGLALDSPSPPESSLSAPILHHQVKGKFALIPPKVRRELRRRRDLESETLDSFRLHSSALARLLGDPIPRYPYFWLIDRRLRQVDRLALQLHLELSYRSAGNRLEAPLPLWLKRVCPDDAAGCPARVREFVESLPTPAPSERERFMRDFCLWFLCGADDVLDVLEQLVENTISSLELEYLHPDHDKLAVLARWLERAQAIVEEIARASTQLPLSERDRVKALADKIEVRRRRLNGDTVEMTSRAGLEGPITVELHGGFRKH